MGVGEIGSDARRDRILHQAWLVLLAAATLLATALLCAGVIGRTRARRFEIEESGARTTDRKVIAATLGIPEVEAADTRIFRRLDDLSQPFLVLHEAANRLQSAYHACVARCVSCLGLALAVLGLSVTVFHGSKDFEVYAAATEVVALIAALHQWWAARVANHRWIAARTKVELLRQWTFLHALLQPASGDARAGQARRAFDAKAAEVEAVLFKGQPAGWWQWIATVLLPGPAHLSETLEERVRQHWDKTRTQYAAMPGGVDLAPGDIHLYLRRRPVRQLAWFRLAQERLRRSGKLREVAMAGLFLLSAVLALCKAALVAYEHREGAHAAVSGGPTVVDFMAMGLLAVTTLSAALTTLYLSRNDRSLLHRYAAQERRIEDWLGRVLGRPSASAPLDIAQPSLQGRFRDEVLDFEELMVEELIDWIHISAHDSLELAP